MKTITDLIEEKLFTEPFWNANDAVRYDALRRLTPDQFKELCTRNLNGENFDGMVEQLAVALANKTLKSSASPETEYPKCRHCGSDKGSWFSRVIPMGNFCEKCGGPWTETDGVE